MNRRRRLNQLGASIITNPNSKDGSYHAKFGKFFGKRDGGTRKFFRKAGKVIQKEVLPVALAIAGNAVGGPVGGTIGGAIGGSLRGSHNIGQNMLKGGLKGFGISAGMNMAGNVMNGGGLSSIFGGGSKPGSSNIFGGLSDLIGGAGKSVGNLFSGAGETLGGLFSGEGGGGLGDLFGKGGLNKLLLGTALLGNLAAKEKPANPQQQAQFNQIANPSHPMDRLPRPEFSHMPRPNPNYGRNIDFSRPHRFDDAFIDPNTAPLPINYAHGGYVHGGFIPGDSSGQADDFDAYIRPGSYVQDAPTVSGLGDGNSFNGKRQFQQLRENFYNSNYVPKNQNQSMELIKVKLSPGEEVIEPEIVEWVGKGNSKAGVKIFDNMRKELRKQKGFKKFHPPKSKPLSAYLR